MNQMNLLKDEVTNCLEKLCHSADAKHNSAIVFYCDSDKSSAAYNLNEDMHDMFFVILKTIQSIDYEAGPGELADEVSVAICDFWYWRNQSAR